MPRGLRMIGLLTGYRDTGATVEQVINSILKTDAGELVASFNIRELFDFRSRRPVIKLEGTKIAEYLEPRLDIRIIKDSLGMPFLLLSGFEPDFKWDEFVAKVFEIIEFFGVESFTWGQGVPMPVPHTRPIRLAVTGTRKDIVDKLSVWQISVEAPANCLHLLEYRLTQAQFPVLGIVALVPHYLADSVFPSSGIRLIEALGTASFVLASTDAIRENERRFLNNFNKSLTHNEDALNLISMLEKQYDAFMKGTVLENPFANANGVVPNAESIAEEVERHLRLRSEL